MRRVCLIVDHPVRDLDGMVLLACELAKRGIEVYLVPMYQRYEVFLFQPDLVLVNYVRFANISFIEACNKLGILIGVLDTEGGIRKDVEAFAKAASPYLDQLSLYCLWGRRQLEALSKYAGSMSLTLELTGCPRYDFATRPWIDAVPEVHIENEKVILVNTNFPIINPRFQSADEETEELVRGMGYEKQYVKELVKQSQVSQAEILRTTKYLASRFPDVLFVVRPHPFEDKRLYETVFAGQEQENVKVIQGGSIFEWVKKAKVVIHHNCSTAIETFLMGKEPIFLRWIKAPLLEQPSTVAVSHRAVSLAKLEEMVKTVLDGKKLEVPVEVEANRKKIIEEFYYANDGRCCSRVADAIERVLREDCDKRETGGWWSFRVKVILAQGRFRGVAQLLIIVVTGLSVFSRLRSFLKRVQARSDKKFSVEHVRGILGRLGKVGADYDGIVASQAARKDAFLKVVGEYSSVRVYSTNDNQGYFRRSYENNQRT